VKELKYEKQFAELKELLRPVESGEGIEISTAVPSTSPN